MEKEQLKAIHTFYVSREIGLLTALEKKLGSRISEVVTKVNSENLCNTYLASLPPGNRSLSLFMKLLWEPLKSKGFNFTMEQKDDGIQLRCTACPWAALYRELGGAEWGFRLYCAADEPLVNSYNPAIQFRRSKTLMEGDDHCDHFYREE